MVLIKFLKRILEGIFYPVRSNARFFFFMYILGIAGSYIVVPHWRGAKVYDNLWLELLLDIYVVCLVLCLFPQKVRRWVRAVFAVVAYVLALVDVFCFVKFGSTLNPTMLLLASETTGREASEFLSSYLSADVLFSGCGWILLIALVHAACIFVSKSKRWQQLSGRTASLAAHNRYTAALFFILHSSFCILLVWAAVTSWSNKVEMADMFSKQNIGQVEHELTTKDHANFYIPAYRLAFSLFSNQLTDEQVDKLIAAKDKVQVDSCSYRSPVIVLVIGESYNKDHAQLYGYKKKTTPRQVALRKTGRLVPFTDVVAPWNLTSYVFKNMFSMHVVGQKGEWCDYPLFPEIFRKAGYHVTFLTNQFLPRAKEEVFDFSGGFFLNNPVLSEAQFDTRNEKVHALDEGILKDFDMLGERREENAQGQLFIFHLMGQHVNYRQRYPKDRRRWTGDDYERPDLSGHKRNILADYDNATLYNDSIVDQIVKRFDNKEAVVIYLADHGEECFDDGYKYFGRDHSAEITARLAHQEFDVPFWIWCSHKYVMAHPDIFSEIIQARKRRMMTDALPHLLLYLAGIQSKDYHEEYNVLSPNYNEQRPRIIKAKVDYDKKMKDEKLKMKDEN